MANSQSQRTKVFVSYSHVDAKWLNRLKTFLGPLSQVGIDIWEDTKIEPGLDWITEIKNALASTKIAILLVSPDFLNSQFIVNQELPHLLHAVEKEGVRVLPVILSPCRYEKSPLSRFQSVNPPNKTLIQIQPFEVNEVFNRVADLIEELIPPPLPPIALELAAGVPVVPSLPPENMPPLPTTRFIGRDKNIQRLKEQIKAGGLVVVHGIFGIGKSSLTLQVAHQLYNAEELPGGIAWINCDLYKTYDACLQQTAQVFFGKSFDNIKQCDEKVRSYLQSKKSLVVLDNVNAVVVERDLIKWLNRIPKQFLSCIVVTTRAVPQELPVGLWIHQLSDDDAQRLFIENSDERVKENLKGRLLNQVRKICVNVGNHPRWLIMIAGRTSMELIDSLVQETDGYSQKDPQELLHQELNPLYESLDQESQIMFTKLSVLPGEISKEVIKAVMDITNWPNVATKLVRATMWERGSNERYVVHPLVRKFARQKLGNQRVETEREVARKVTKLAQEMSQLTQPDVTCTKLRVDEMEEALKEIGDALNWFEAEWLNLQACAEYTQQLGDAETLCALTDTILQFMIRRGHWQDCEKLYLKARTTRQRLNDPAGTARTLNDLGVCQQFLGQFDEAIACFKQSIELQEALQRENSDNFNIEQLPKILNSLGFNYYKQNNIRDADAAFIKARKICEQFLTGKEENDVNTTEVISREAMKLCEKMMRERELLDEPPDKAWVESCRVAVELSQTYSNLGLLYTHKFNLKLEEGETEQADIEFQRAETAFECSLKIRRERDPRQAQTLNRQGNLYLLKEWWGFAANKFRQSQIDLEKVYDNFELGVSHRGLGIFAKEKDHLDEAAQEFKKSLQYFKNNPDEEAEVYNQLALLYLKLDQDKAMQEVGKAEQAAALTDDNNLINKIRNTKRIILDSYRSDSGIH